MSRHEATGCAQRQLTFFVDAATTVAGDMPPHISSQVDHYTMFTDGACRGNPGPAGVGIMCLKNQRLLWQKGFFIGTATNNIAEYGAVIIGLQLLLSKVQGARVGLEILADSQLLVFQLNGTYKAKSLHIQQLLAQAKQLLQHFNWTARHIPRAQNVVADKLANAGLDKKTPLPASVQWHCKLPSL